VRRQLREANQVADGDCVIVLAARLERWKGHQLLIEALSRLRGDAQWECWIAGGPQSTAQETYLGELRMLATELGIESRVRFLGHRDDVPDLLVAADVHCQPNTGPEPFGVAFVEALAAGLPVVTTRMGAAPEIVQRDNGHLTSTTDPSELADALAALIDRPDVRSAFARTAAARAAELCDADRVLPQLCVQLNSLI
jgi:glycosyltransferase involved in cell wall biosynthesis